MARGDLVVTRLIVGLLWEAEEKATSCSLVRVRKAIRLQKLVQGGGLFLMVAEDIGCQWGAVVRRLEGDD